MENRRWPDVEITGIYQFGVMPVKHKVKVQVPVEKCEIKEAVSDAFAWGTRGQFFWEGNKRTSMTLANKILIAAGAGILTITDTHMERFHMLLLDYYNTGKSEALKDFLYKNTIRGITI